MRQVVSTRRPRPWRADAGLATALILNLWTVALVAAEPTLEQRIVFGPDSAPRWRAIESTVEASTAQTRTGAATLHWHVPVDYSAGEANYPIGWPRLNYALRDAATRDWSAWDYFEFWAYVATTRPTLPREPAGVAVQTPDKHSAYSRVLAELKQGEWVHVRIPVIELPRPHDVRAVQFHISESDYADGDALDFYLDGLALTRYAQPTLLAFAPETAVAFTDARTLAVTFQLAGIPAGQAVEMTCELRNRAGRAAEVTARASRGPQRIVLKLGDAGLPSGDYEVAARVPGGVEATARVRLVESPWQATAR